LLGAKSLVSVTANPNNHSQVFVAAMHQGILELNDGVATNLWGYTNSGLESIDPEEFGENPSYRSVRVRDIAIDNEGSMWSITSFIANGLKKRMQSGTWVDVDLIPVIEKVTNPTGYSKLEISPNNEVYVGSSSSGLIGYSERNGTPLLRSLSTSQNLPSVDVRSIALDNDDNLWIGTPEGLRVLFGVSRMFTLDNVQASTIIIEEGGKVGELLSNQFITAIEVDGNNQKWVSTANAGVFLFSEDGKKTLEHFTKDNSPLPSSSIRSLAYDETTGQIYIGTPIGLVAFQGNASSPGENLSNVEVYPNPVRPGYTGKVTVRGLLADCVVKITDIVGNAVHETTSSGGSVQWNLQSFDGNRVRSGVYLIFVTNSDGTETAVEKVMIIN
jgi:ligand-binding sensor domain-containing protein